LKYESVWSQEEDWDGRGREFKWEFETGMHLTIACIHCYLRLMTPLCSGGWKGSHNTARGLAVHHILHPIIMFMPMGNIC